MAISYTFAIATPAPVGQVNREVTDAAQALGLFDTTVAAEPLLDAVTRRGTRLHVYQPGPPSWGSSTIMTDLGFEPTVSVGFRLDKFGSVVDQQDDMIRVVDDLLGRVPGDAVLHFQYDSIWLLRRGKELTLNEDNDIWRPHRLAGLSRPYHHATHTFS